MGRWAAVIVSVFVVVSSCSTTAESTVVDQATVVTSTTQPAGTTTTVSTTTTLAGTTTEASIPQVDLDGSGIVGMWWPPGEQLATQPEPPLVILVPGGGWVSADPTGLVPLAEALADAGAIAATITHRTATDDAYFPVPAQDIACAVAHVVAVARSSGHEPDEVIVFGHSSGAQLGALVALQPLKFSSECDYPAVTPDRFIGLAGPYDVVQAQRFAGDLFGPDNTNVDHWTTGNPIDQADERPELEVLLIHGTGDRTVPVQFTETFAAALIDGNHTVDTVYPDGIDHHAVYSAEIATPLITAWLNL